MKEKASRGWHLGTLSIIMVTAAAMRLWGISFGLPYVYFPDEAVLVNHAVGFGTGNFNPSYFIYPSLYMYVLFLIYGLSYVTGWLIGIFHSTTDFVRLFFSDATLFYLPGRLIAAFCGVISVGVTYLLGRRAYSPVVGLIAAAFLSVNVLHVSYSHYVKTHVPAGLLVILGLLLAWSIYNGTHSWRDYVIAGAVAGLAASTVYHAGFVLISIGFAHMLRWHATSGGTARQLLGPKIFGAAAASLLSFSLTTPFAILDWGTFKGDLTSTAAVFYRGGFWERGTLYPFTSLPDSMGQPLGLVALAGLGYALVRRRSADLIILSQPLFLGAFLMLFRAKEYQHMLIAFPALCILSASFVTDAVKWLFRPPVLSTAGLIVATLSISAVPARICIKSNHRLTLPDTRTLAKEWIEQNLPPGAKIVMDSGKYYLGVFGPPLRVSRWTLERFIERSQSVNGESLAGRVGTRRVGYTGEAEYFRQELQTIGNQSGFDIIQILHDRGLSEPGVLTLEEYTSMGAQYAIVSELATSSYTPQMEEAVRYPHKAARYRDFYRTLDNRAILLKQFNPSETVQGPALRIYELQELN